MSAFEIEILPGAFTIHRLAPTTPLPAVVQERPFVWIGRSERELSIVCEGGLLQDVAVERTEPGWRALRLRGPLDFSLVGVLADLSALLARRQISIFALSTFDTDTLLVRDRDLGDARAALENGGHVLLEFP